MNFFQRFFGVFFNSNETFKNLSEKPVWVDALIVLLVFLILISYLTFPFQSKDSAELMKSNVKLKERLGEERFNQMIENLENPSPTRRIFTAFIFAPIGGIIGFFLSAGIIFGISRIFSSYGKFKALLAVFLHANFIDKVFGNLVRYLLILSKKSVFQVSTGLPILFPRLEVTSTSYVILSQFDFFQIWMFGILAFGISHIFKISLKKSLFISYGFWVLKSLVSILFGLISLRAYG
ncbi:YIP1 family protein [Candidatus Aminicenantes bacterium AC-335-A11]|jgi:hypothetical protein|nr:YIP1 family protein [SCandidatus Aminicenantes bacterium Aminicenantia_JdfR_composite]MCP2596998.1 YIP1 family protein [Candidatus Aminicenantes bacterium AC-335-G13]MCP2606040.1 YIP1 family protein [Candidatus Aminicenantes bacterium AC-708-I09]MCP2619075.1 YIP1 family protein [Candidatus Aminicenantes bacterium AC-335-A11]MCP2620610.1 YIP1 family protein [Candidatus Aminicenantes bacterium AC-334-E05]